MIRQTLIKAWREAAAGNEEAIRAMDEAERFWHDNSFILHRPIFLQIQRESGPIPSEDSLPAILSEEPATISLFMSFADLFRFKPVV